MRYFQSSFRLEWQDTPAGLAIHAVDDHTNEIYTYSQELKTWHQDRDTAGYFYFPELHDHEMTFTELTRDKLYGLLPAVPRMDRRDDAQRGISNKARAQIAKSGRVLTSAEVGLLTKPLRQFPVAAPMLKKLLETRSQHKRWTALFLYEEDGPARRKAISNLRTNPRINVSTKGDPLEAQHRTRRFVIDGQRHIYTAVEAKYVKPAAQERSQEEGTDD